MNELTKELVRGLMEVDDTKIVALYGGGFKPPIAGHFNVVKQALKDYPEIDEFKIFVGGKERDGIDQEEALLIWDIYKNYLSNKITIEPSSNPIGSIYSHSKKNLNDEVYWVLGRREGAEDDNKDIELRQQSLKAKPESYPNLSVKVITTDDEGMRGRNARKAINNREEFFKFLPQELEVQDKEKVFDLISPTLNEGITKNELNSIESYADSLFNKLGIDIDFTKHFFDRLNDIRNKKPISVAELIGVFKKLYKKHGKPLSRTEDDLEAVVKDFNKNINIPFVIDVDQNGIDMTAKTIMRKPDFKTSNPIIALEEELTQEVPEFFYHATYGALLPSIEATGLDTREAALAWEDSKPGIVYLANDPAIAESYAEASDEVSDEIYDSGIVILKVASKDLDLSKLYDDSNVIEDDSDTYEYHGQIPWSKLSITNLYDDLKEEIIKIIKENKIVLPVDEPIVLQADSEKYKRGLIVTWKSDGGYDVQYWFNTPDNIVPAELKGDGESFGDITNVWLGYHPELDDKKLYENTTYSNHIDYKQQIKDLTKYMLDTGMNIEPLPNVIFKHKDKSNAKDFFGKTAYYNPNTQEIVLYTEGRHPKDVVRSFSHEMIHHIQNLEGRLGDITTTNTTEDDKLDKIEQEAYLRGNMVFRNWTDSLNKGVTTNISEKKKKTKDPFGITAYALELARGLEEEIINEGKYDSLITKLAGWTLNSWKDDFKEGENEGRIELEIGPGKDFDYPHLDFKYKAIAKFGGLYHDKSFARPLKSEVIIQYWLDIEELPRMWSRIAMDLRNTIRHEIEHLMQSGPNVKKGKEKQKDYSERDEIKTGKKKWWKIWRKTLGTPDYYKLEKEVDANLQGLYLKAKKSRTPLKDVIDSYVSYDLNLPIKDQEEIKAIWRERAPKLNIPLFENEEEKEYIIYSDMDGVVANFNERFKEFSDNLLPQDYVDKFGLEKFWELIDEVGVRFWIGINWMPDGKKYWNYIKKYNPILLSAPSRKNESRLGKRIWAKKYMPGTKVILAYADNKKNYADGNSILIDDRKKNIEQWKAAGGIGILHTDADSTIAQLKELGL